ncbi:MAG: nucleotidyltransferase [Clostridia bacterium]|nr:nucleotidyltransferase [Clostridia bacterium]
MKKEPILVILAAGMGSRYGGLKQIDAMDEHGHIIMDFSLFDAYRAGFRRVVFIIKRELEETFREVIGDRIAKYMQVSYAFQELTNIPEGFTVPEGRVKPWGTTHAIIAAKDYVDAPFAVINADDYYGKEAFAKLYNFLTTTEDTDKFHYAMVGYMLKNTLTDNGSVARGVCRVDENHMLTAINERTRIEKKDGGAAYTEDGGETWITLPVDNPVSMNMWAFTESIMGKLNDYFHEFMEKEVPANPLKSECFLPNVVGYMLNDGLCDVLVMETPDKWYGVTYQEDRPGVTKAIRDLKDAGVYPAKLWEEI